MFLDAELRWRGAIERRTGLLPDPVGSFGCTASNSDHTPRGSSEPVVPTTTATVRGVPLVTPGSEVSTYCHIAADRLDRPIGC